MTMLKMLPEVIRSEKFLGVIALAEFVNLSQVLNAGFPIAVCYSFHFLVS
jgi:hypothetical protein